MKHWSNKSIHKQLFNLNDFWIKMVGYDSFVVVACINNRNLYLRRFTNNEFRFIPNYQFATKYTQKTAEKYLRYLRTGLENVILFTNNHDKNIICLINNCDSN